VGRLFGPIMVAWFVMLAVLGIAWIARYPDVLAALNPLHGIRFLIENRGHGFAVLGAVFLVVTGGEALYADMGHFGPRPIRLAWFAVVLPALVLNYFGQGALLLHSPDTQDPFFELTPGWALLPLVGMATAAAIIASQALISGAFSLTQQAIQLVYAPRLNVEHTSSWGWLPIAIGVALFTLMTTWKTGRRLVAERLTARAFPLEDFVAAVTVTPPTRVHGTAIFMTAQPTGTPAALVHNLRYNKMLHQHVVVLTVSTVPRPHVNPDERVTVLPMGANIYNTRIQYGFMEDPDVPEVLVHLRQVGVPIDEDDVTFFLGRETIVVGRRNGMATWREKLFVLMARNAVRATAFFKLPPERVVELGVQVEM
jgi:K+ transporter